MGKPRVQIAAGSPSESLVMSGAMEKIRVGVSMSTRWTDPPILLIAGILGTPVVLSVASYYLATLVHIAAVPAMFLSLVIYYNYVYLPCGPANTSKYIGFKDEALRKQYGNARIPIVTLYEAYLDDKLEFNGDVLAILRDHRDDFVSYKPTFSLIKFLVLQIFPQTSSSFKNKKATKKEIAEHYDRGNYFFNAFLGPRMVYTSGVYRGLHQSLETAQDNKMDLICEKLMVKPGERFLDIGCGWGTLARHAAKHFKAKAVGVTLSVEGAAWCNEKNGEEGIEEDCKILCMDYRDIPENVKFSRISSIEMAEHVGLKNFQVYLKKVKDLLTDDGTFLMQVAGLRQGSNWQDVQWGLFMSRYIFPGADASTPLNWYVRQMELAGFEVRSVETIGRHYSHTLHGWYKHWMKNRSAMAAKYPPHLIRLWDFFLAWSVVAAGQGSATCYQILAHKNIYNFNRDAFCNEVVPSVGVFKASK